MFKITGFTTVLLVLVTASPSVWGQQVPPVFDPTAVLAATRQTVKVFTEREADAVKAERTFCEGSLRAADQKLLDASDQDPAAVQALAQVAVAEQERCDDATSARLEAKDTLAKARKLLRLLALDRQACSSAVKPCMAQGMAGEVMAAQAKGDTAPSTVSRLLASAELLANTTGQQGAAAVTTAVLVKSAAGAQERVNDMKAKVADAYAVGDAAAAAALSASVPDAAAASQALAAFGAAKAAREAVGNAQSASNALVFNTLHVVQSCGQAGLAKCDKPENLELRNRAAAAQVDLDSKLRESKEIYKKAKQAAIEVEARVNFTDDEAERAIRFLRALDENPDAKALFGKDSYKVSAGKGGAGLAIKINREKFGPDWLRQTSVLISTPAAETGRSSIYKLADGLSSASQIEVATGVFGAGGLRSDDNSWFLRQWKSSITVAHQRLGYFETGDLSTEAKRTLVPWALSLSSAFSPLSNVQGDDAPLRANSHFIKLSWQREVDAGESAITCPVAFADGNLKRENFVTCASGPTVAPKLRSARLFQYEYNFKAKVGPDFSISIKHNDVSHVTNVDVPIYLLKTSSDKDSPIHAGVNLGWSSKGGGAFGVFLGAPLTLDRIGR